MSIVTFWGTGKEQVGKTLAVVAIATNMAIEHNKKILVVSASYNNDTLKNCYWTEENTKKNSIFRPKNGIELDNGIEGLAKMVQSNKVSPEVITDYTKVVFKDRLEILLGFDERTSSSSEEVAQIYFEIVQLASEYYDMIFVDLDNEISLVATDGILNNSDLIIAMTSQKIASIVKLQQKKAQLPQSKVMLLVGKYDRKSKYSIKNLSRMIKQKKEILAIPYNTLYFEAAQEGKVPDLFLRLRRIEDKNDGNAFFIEQVKRATQEIIEKIENDKLIN